jgi:GTP-binding protein EngB required for normal cell division
MERIRIAVVGRTKSGKSSLINALLGEELCCVGAAVDTTDKIHKLGAEQNGDPGVYLVDTPGIGADEEYEARTLAYLGIAGHESHRPVSIVPICRLRKEADCPHKQVHQNRGHYPMAFQERTLKGGGRLISCRNSKCPNFLPIHAGNPEVVEEQPDVLLFLVHRGLSTSDRVLWRQLQEKYGNGCLLPVLTRVDELNDKEKTEVLPAVEEQMRQAPLPVSATCGTGMDTLRSRLSTVLHELAADAFGRTEQAISSIFGASPEAARVDEVRAFELSFHAVPYTLVLRRRGDTWDGSLQCPAKRWKAKVETEPGFFGIGLFRVHIEGKHPGRVRPDEIEIRPVSHWEGRHGFEMVACDASWDWTSVDAKLVKWDR